MPEAPETDLQADLLRYLPRRWKGRWQRLSKRAKTASKIGAVVFPAIGVLSGAYAYAPAIEISPSVIGSETDPSAVEFLFHNIGRLSLRKNHIECDIRASNGRFKMADNFVHSPGREMAQYIEDFSSGARATRNCLQLFPFPIRPLFPATITISMNSKWPKYWPILPWTSTARFVSSRDSSGHVQIVPDDE